MKNKITKAAIDIVSKIGLINLTRQSLCDSVNIADGSFYSIMGVTFTEFAKSLTEYDVYHITDCKRANINVRKQHILASAIIVAKNKSYNKMTREDVANEAGVSLSLITHRFNTMAQLRCDVMRYAIKNEIVEIIAQGLAYRDKRAIRISQELKHKVAKYIGSL